MSRSKKVFQPTQSQIRLLRLLNLPYDVNSDYYAIAELLHANGFPKNGLPEDVNPMKVRNWTDKELLLMAIKQKHMLDEHGMKWCSVCKDYHEIKHDEC
ncbi:hypothetical protein ACQCN2_17890 [Brevibacillus ginsengisoli]|uniref:hypothetical protein n=1 Tax=Brevibacillus ginsengisoli TaxID=363854 RepID=UPI003CED6432